MAINENEMIKCVDEHEEEDEAMKCIDEFLVKKEAYKQAFMADGMHSEEAEGMADELASYLLRK